MLFWIIILVIFVLFLAEEIFFTKRLQSKYKQRRKQLLNECASLNKKESEHKRQVDDLDSILSERFLFYDTARKIAPILDKKELFSVFAEELKYLGHIETVEIGVSSKKTKGLRFGLGKDSKDILYVETKSKAVAEHIPYFAKLLRLCLERIKLYEQLQQMSIYDSFTKVYTRRYFMLRFLEEFNRAEKFSLNLSFLMLDIDHFKKINDTYGHLVGDAVLREVARLIRENTREIDFVARFGGEEFSVILPETDKAGAIMMAERISSRISRERISVFDEILTVNISVGVSSYPQNSIHSDVLIEVADKALYKAKLSGRNKVCWF